MLRHKSETAHHGQSTIYRSINRETGIKYSHLCGAQYGVFRQDDRGSWRDVVYRRGCYDNVSSLSHRFRSHWMRCAHHAARLHLDEEAKNFNAGLPSHTRHTVGSICDCCCRGCFQYSSSYHFFHDSWRRGCISPGSAAYL